MKIAIIGSTQYMDKFIEHKKELEKNGDEVRIPALDNFKGMNEIEVCEYNRKNIEWADEVHLIWDNRSVGTIFDMGMVFALRKPLEIIYIEKRTFENVFRQYEKRWL